MLVLSRKLSQRIVIGKDVRITVVNVEGGRVRLGIEAPMAVSVLRGELDDPRHRDRRNGDGPADRPAAK